MVRKMIRDRLPREVKKLFSCEGEFVLSVGRTVIEAAAREAIGGDDRILPGIVVAIDAKLLRVTAVAVIGDDARGLRFTRQAT